MINDSKIVTFYSYKGGVGRSMALANVAILLAREYGKKVLVIDWDLEAPGLNKFFNIPSTKKGLIDLFYDYKNILMEKEMTFEDDFLNIDKYLIEVTSFSNGSLTILPAGQIDRKYATRVNNFDWDEFYKNWHGFGFIEYLKGQLKKKADIILIDSRTGVTDIGGICTLQMPDIEILLFSLNDQSLSGTIMVAESILKNSINVAEKKEPPILIFIPSRIEKYLEKKILRKWEIIAAERLFKYLYFKRMEDAIIHLKKVSIPYIGFYSFGEILAVEDDPHGELAESFDHLTEMILVATGFLEEETPINDPLSEVFRKSMTEIFNIKNIKNLTNLGALIALIIAFSAIITTFFTLANVNITIPTDLLLNLIIAFLTLLIIQLILKYKRL